MSPQPPERTPEQRDEALKLAQEARAERHAIKVKIATNEISFMDVMERGRRGATDELGQHARVYGGLEIGQVLEAVPSVGTARRDHALAAAGGLDPNTHLDELTEQQREQITVWMSQHRLG